MTTATEFRSGHDATKCEGDTSWKGRLEQLPPPLPIGAEAAARAMHDQGFVQFPDLLTPAEVAELREWMDRSGGPDDTRYEVTGWCYNRHIVGEPHRDPMWLRLIDRSPAFECLEMILGQGFVVFGCSMWTTGKGRRMNLHIDQHMLALPTDVIEDPRVTLPIYSGNLHFYLDDQVGSIGPTVVVPGSWRSGRHPRDESSWRGCEPHTISVRAGGAVLMRHDLWHGAEMNSGDRRRYIIQVHYAYRKRRAHYPPLDHCADRYAPEVLRLVTPRQRVLLGEQVPDLMY
jgi:hypothetical protein